MVHLRRCILPEPSNPAKSQAPDVTTHPFHRAEFLTTAAEWRQLPRGGALEIAFAGRSNSGKSSALNALAQRKRLAYVSRTPGRTQHINFFRLPSGALLADLPGYGYAAVAGAMQRHWRAFLARYLAERETLAGLVLVMDARHPLTALDQQMLGWFLPTERPVHVLLTKSDKLSSAEQRRALRDVRDLIARTFARDASRIGLQLFSAAEPSGVVEAENAIGAWLEVHAPTVSKKERPRHQGE